MNDKEQKRKELLLRLEKTKQIKRESINETIKELKERYERRTGMPANYVFVL